MLLVTEFLARIVDMLLDVSDEMVDKGRGMYSRTSGGPNLIAACCAERRSGGKRKSLD